jgi:hypothetical protein
VVGKLVHASVIDFAVEYEPRQPLGKGVFAYLWESLQQTGTRSQVLYLPGRRIAGKVVNKRQESTLPAVVFEPRPSPRTGSITDVGNGGQQVVMAASIRSLSVSCGVVGILINLLYEPAWTAVEV